MVVAGLTVANEECHHLSRDRGVLVLVANGPAGHIEAGQARFVIDRNPAFLDFIAANHAAGGFGDGDAQHALGVAHGLHIPLRGEVAVVVGIAGGPDMLVARRVFGADQDVVAVLGPAVTGDIAVEDDDTIPLGIETSG